MTNAAFELADLLLEWNRVDHGQFPELVRGAEARPPGEEFWRKHLHAVELLRQVDDVIQGLRLQGKRYSHYENLFPSWAGAVFGYFTPWGVDNQTRVALPESDIHVLTGLGNYIEEVPSLALLDGPRRLNLTGAISDILEILSADSIQLEPNVRRYVFELITSIQRLLAETSVFGSADLLARIHELFGYLTILAEDLDSDESTRAFAVKLREAAWKIVPYVQFAARSGMAALGMVADVKGLSG